MDTKSRNIKYSWGLKLTAAVLLWLAVIGAVGSSIFLLYHEQVVGRSASYYDTYQFEGEFDRLVHNVVEYNVILQSEERIKASGQTEGNIQIQLERYKTIEWRLADSTNFAYYLENTETGEKITNISGTDPVGILQDQATVVHFSKWTSDFNNGHDTLHEDIVAMLQGTSWEIYAAVIEPLQPGDVFYDDAMTYSRVKPWLPAAQGALAASIIIGLVAFSYLVLVSGRREKGGAIDLTWVDRIYFDVHTLLVFLAALISVGIAQASSINTDVGLLVLALVMALDVGIGLNYIFAGIRQIKYGHILRNTLIYKFFKWFFKAIDFKVLKLMFSKDFKGATLILLLAYGMINGFLSSVASANPGFFSVLLLIAFNVAAIYYVAKSLLSLETIMKSVKEISSGNLEHSLDRKQISASFAGMAEDLESIQVGLKKAVAEAVRGERMKTDLITNVSHDLKTPLTSIINYVDLLKKEDLNNETAAGYVQILEEKSLRLKHLINDLIEASKASSGNLAIEAEKIDLHELVQQACGEYAEKFSHTELDVKIRATEEKIFILADGKYMWRIVENLISNVLKYSMPCSRVYIELAQRERFGLLVIKNISANQLNISPEQLTERFVRGDTARTLEGSGLGLSIAQSLTVLQGGRFRIEIDGDLFKVSVEMPSWEI